MNNILILIFYIFIFLHNQFFIILFLSLDILSPLNMDLTGEPKAKKLKTTTSPRQRKNKTPTSRTAATKNRRNSNNSSTISS